MMNRTLRHLFTIAIVAISATRSFAADGWTQTTSTSPITTPYKVGIGTSTAPTKQLEVFGDASFTGLVATQELSVLRAGTVYGRLHQALSQWVAMTINTRYDNGWQLDDPNLTGWFVKADARTGYDQFSIFRIPSGAGAHTDEKQLFVLNGDGNVGIGTGAPTGRLTILVPNSNGYGATFGDMVASEGYGSGVLLTMAGNSMIRVSNLQFGFVGNPSIGSLGTAPLFLNGWSANDVIIGQTGGPTALKVRSTGTSTFAGSVQVAGDLVVTGNVAAKYQDVAEWVPSSSDLEPGTVVVLDTAVGNAVMPSHSPYDTTVAGVVSVQPGLILGEGGAAKEQIATTGRVRVKVDASSAPIRAGDLLVTSDKPGYAMRSIPVELSGIAMHRPGTIVGKALESLPSGQGEILVLLSLQ